MTTFDASAATQDFDFLYSGDAIDFASQVAANATTYSWLTSTGHRVTATGTFAYPGGNVSGFVTSIAIDLANNSNTDIAITNIANADIANLLAGHDLFWSTLFSGGDTFTGPGTVHGTFTGDVIGGGSGVGGADSFTFNLVNTGLEVSGDGGVGVANTTFHGWHDTFSISGSLAAAQDNFVYGDLQSAGNKTAYGGDDTFSISLSGSVVLSVFGDLRYSEESQTTGG
ncbi:MAG: hypothetical protein KDJ77_11135, partial [Rhodobiaceae bacterium]|nr:hypothetical protein [Rhodobiaceae bacterium]